MKKSNWHGGKGSGRRGSDDSKYADNWDKIFKKEKELFSELNHKRKGGDDIEWPERKNINNREIPKK